MITSPDGHIFALPITHYNMEMAGEARKAFLEVKPTCVAVELPETMEEEFLRAAARLPDIGLVVAFGQHIDPLYTMVEPCDPLMEALRSATEEGVPAYCVDLDVDRYPQFHEPLPDPYSITKIGLAAYYDAFEKVGIKSMQRTSLDNHRELFMAKKLKELSLRYERVLFVGGMFHVRRVLELMDRGRFESYSHAERQGAHLCTLTEESLREVMGEAAWFTMAYEKARESAPFVTPDRQKLLLQLYRKGAKNYTKENKIPFPGYHFRNLMKFARNYSFIKGRLMPDLFQILSTAKGCVEHNYAYEVWAIATEYPHLKNVDGLDEIDMTAADIWGHSKSIHFHLREPSRKNFFQMHRRREKKQFQFDPPGPFSICSYPPEDVKIEKFGDFLKKKGTQILSEEAARTIPFSTSLEDGLDVRETIRHFAEGKLYVKVQGKPPGGVGSVVIIFDEDEANKYSWTTTWLGEHDQESDMAYYATPTTKNVVGPGISRCEYGGLMMSYPPRRMFDIWRDPDYAGLKTKAEVLLVAAIDYSVQPLVTYVAARPPRGMIKSFARRFGKKVVYIPIGQLSPVTLEQIRTFHVLDGRDRRSIAGEFIDL